jgi:hypothetical protein
VTLVHDERMRHDAVALFGEAVAEVLDDTVGGELVGTWFVGSVALGGYIAGQSDIDIVAVCDGALTRPQKQQVAAAIVEVSTTCPTRGLEFTLYRREVAGSLPMGADFEVNANGGPGMTTAIHLDPAAEPGFWYVLDRAIAHRAGVVIGGPRPAQLFADVPRPTVLDALYQSMGWHRLHEKATLYSVLNACRAWRFADEGVLGSKLEGAAWARERWPDTDVIDAAVALREGKDAALADSAVDDLLSAVIDRLAEARRD